MATTPARSRPPAPSTRTERRWWDQGARVVGIDEVGRGAWAGPVTVGAVVLNPARLLRGLRDSKTLRPPRREELAVRLAEHAEDVAIGRVDNVEVDRLGLGAALRLATQRAVDALTNPPDVALIDGTVDLLAGTGMPVETLVGGDARSTSIAAASIVAKVHRDTEMCAHDPHHPRYGFASNKGYPSPQHRRAIAEHGPCALHRRSWSPFTEQPTLFDDT